MVGGKPNLDSQQSPSVRSKRIRRKKKGNPLSSPVAHSQDQISEEERKPLQMEFGNTIPKLEWYYRSHEGLSLHGRLQPLLKYPVTVLALCKDFRFINGTLSGSGPAILPIQPPPRDPSLSLHEWYTLWDEDIRRAVSAMRKVDPKNRKIRRYAENLEVLEFIRATMDAVLVAYQTERSWYLKKYNLNTRLNSSRLQGLERFKSQLVYHPLEAAQRVKVLSQANRAWLFGGPKPKGRLMVFADKRVAIKVSYAARALPPAPPDPKGLLDLVSRLTSEPPEEHPDWREFVKAYFGRWKIPPATKDLFTMPSSNAALGYPRSAGGHVTGVQHLVLLGYALRKTRGDPTRPHSNADEDGAYLELLSDSLHPDSQLNPPKEDYASLFSGSWEELEKSLPGTGHFLQQYLREGVEYVMDSITYTPILPIVAEEKGLKTRFPTCSLTAANLVQQVLRRVIDAIMVKDPRFSAALGGDLQVDMRGEAGPWYSLDATAATDLHPQWVTQTVYEELADRYPVLQKYRKWFTKLFGPKKILLGKTSSDLTPVRLMRHYPRAPLLDDRYTPGIKEWEHGHASFILSIWNDWIRDLNTVGGVITSTGQMMGDPTSFPPMMLVTLFSAEQALREFPYTPSERRRTYKGLRRADAKLRGVGDDGLLPRWHEGRKRVFDETFPKLGGRLSAAKSFWHKKYALITEIPMDNGFEQPFLPLSVIVAPPGGSKGQLSWVSQATSIVGDATAPYERPMKFFYRLSPFWYSWQLASRWGIPVSAPEAYGGVNVPIRPKVSQTHHLQWLRYLSQASIEELVTGLGLSPVGNAASSLLRKASDGWLKQVFHADSEWKSFSEGLLSPMALDDSAQRRIPLTEAYQTAVGNLRSVEFYFRAPLEISEMRAPSIRAAARKFQSKVSKARCTKVRGYQATNDDLQRKLSLYFTSSGGFLPDPWSEPIRGFYGLETSIRVRRRYKAPHLLGFG
uniref:RNA dependent RNA polymerase n=1 Tax=Downy mildew lesion associated orfanplasmovirus 7 TaxID=3070633 RepID=A0AA51UAK2_9VIRU|nr:MAG: putative RNA dependent RNA polymerase [Plasmopara viticola lesion associated orfanplasmovirus 7]